MAITAAEIQIILTATATQSQEKLAAAQSAIGKITAKVVSAQATMKASEKPLTMGATPEAVAKLQANIGRMSAAIAVVSAKVIQAQAAMKASERPLTMGATPEVVAQVQSNVSQMGAAIQGAETNIMGALSRMSSGFTKMAMGLGGIVAALIAAGMPMKGFHDQMDRLAGTMPDVAGRTNEIKTRLQQL